MKFLAAMVAKKMSRHGVIMHCNYCGEPDHNIKGCKYLKAGLPPPNVQAPPQPHAEGAPNVGDFINHVCLSSFLL